MIATGNIYLRRLIFPISLQAVLWNRPLSNFSTITQDHSKVDATTEIPPTAPRTIKIKKEKYVPITIEAAKKNIKKSPLKMKFLVSLVRSIIESYCI